MRVHHHVDYQYPRARLVPLQSLPRHRNLGMLKGRLNVPSDLDAPIPNEMITQFESSSIEPSTGNR